MHFKMKYPGLLAKTTIISLCERPRKTFHFGHFFAKDFVDMAKAKSVTP